MQKPNWREWKHTPDVTVWQACALSLDINPYRLVPDIRLMGRYPSKGPFFLSQNFASKEVEEEFDLRQRLLLRNLPNYTSFPTRYRDRWEGSRREGNSLVRLPEFASWAVSVVMWEGMPPELIELAIALARTELSPPTIPPPPISDRQTLLRQRKSVTIAEAAEILTGIAGWTKENRAAMGLIREAIQDDELEPESVHYFDEDAWTFDASRAVIDQGATTVTLANFDAWRARTFLPTESTPTANSAPQVPEEARGQAASSGATANSAPESTPIGISKREILAVGWPLPQDAPPLQNILDEVPKWVEEACIKVGRRGKGADGSHLWNPAILAACLATTTPQKKWKANKAALTNLLSRSFPEYLQQWEEALERL